MDRPLDPDIEALASEVARHLRTHFVSPTALESPAGGSDTSAGRPGAAGEGLASPLPVDALASAIVDRMRAPTPAVDESRQQVEELADRVAAAIRREIEGSDSSVLQEESVDVSEIAAEEDDGKDDAESSRPGQEGASQESSDFDSDVS